MLKKGKGRPRPHMEAVMGLPARRAEGGAPAGLVLISDPYPVKFTFGDSEAYLTGV